MLSFISWSSFIWFLVWLLICYYLFVFLFYFRNEMFSLPGKGAVMLRFQSEGGESKTDEKKSGDDMSFAAVHELLEDLKTVFAEAVKTRSVKEELLQGIRSRLKNYPDLKNSDLREDIGNHIRIECRDICGMELDDPELSALWN